MRSLLILGLLLLLCLDASHEQPAASPLTPIPDSFITFSLPGQSYPVGALGVPLFYLTDLDVTLTAPALDIEGFEFELVLPSSCILTSIALADRTTVEQPTELRFVVDLGSCTPVGSYLRMATLTFFCLPPNPGDQLCFASSALGLPFEVRPTVTPCGGVPTCLSLVSGDGYATPACIQINPSGSPINPITSILDCSEAVVIPVGGISWGVLKATF